MKREIPELLIPFLPDTETTMYSFEEALNSIEENYSFSEVRIYLDTIKLDEGVISFQGKDYPASRWALESLCKICGLSTATVFRLELDELIKFIDIRTSGQQNEIIIFQDKARSRVVNIVKAPYYRASNADVLAMFQDLNSKYSWNSKEIRICEKGIQLSLITDMFGEIEPVVGDITKTGFSVINSETGDRPLNAHFFLFRLTCLNGAVLRDMWGQARWTYDKRMRLETSLRTFRRKLEGMQFPLKLLEKKFGGLVAEKITDLDFRKIWRQLSSVIGTKEADSILEVEEEERKTILRIVKDRERINRKCFSPDKKKGPVPFDMTFYEILQLVTAKAKNYPFSTKRQLERLGGKIIG